ACIASRRRVRDAADARRTAVQTAAGHVAAVANPRVHYLGLCLVAASAWMMARGAHSLHVLGERRFEMIRGVELALHVSVIGDARAPFYGRPVHRPWRALAGGLAGRATR